MLATALEAGPLDDGYPVTTWTVADLTDLLGRHGYPVSTATTYRALHAMGYRYRRPRHDLTHHQDLEAVAAAKHVVAELQQRGLLPVLDSGLSPWMNVPSTPAPTWRTSGADAADRTVFGALDDASGDVIWRICPAKGGDAFAAVLQQLAETWPDEQLVLVLDTARYHRSPVVRLWWATQKGRITAFWLPVSNPQLNLIKRVWQFLKQTLVCHRFWNDGDGLDAAAATVLDRIEAHVHPTDGPAIRLV